MATQGAKGIVQSVKPILSVDQLEAKRRVIALYKAWYREIPRSILHYSADLTAREGRRRLKNEFLRHKDVKDIRVIDMLVIKGQMELKELCLRWKQKSHFMYLTKDWIPPPATFISKFLQGRQQNKMEEFRSILGGVLTTLRVAGEGKKEDEALWISCEILFGAKKSVLHLRQRSRYADKYE